MALNVYIPSEEKIIHETSVDFSYRPIPNLIHVVQYDRRLPIVAVSLYSSGKPYSVPALMDVRVRVGKKDKTFVYKSVLGCNEARNVVYFDIDEQMVFFNGPLDPVIELFIQDSVDTYHKASSSPIPIAVDRNPIQDYYLESREEYVILDEILAEVRELRDETEGYRDEVMNSLSHYLPLTGGTMTGDIIMSGTGTRITAPLIKSTRIIFDDALNVRIDGTSDTLAFTADKILLQGNTTTMNLVGHTNNVDDIGTNTVRYRTGYFNYINALSNIVINGNTITAAAGTYTHTLQAKSGTIAFISDIDTLGTSLQNAINAETNARIAADGTLQSNINNNKTLIDIINALIPSQAAPTNQLADKDFVNSSIANMAARYITQTAAGDTQWPSLASLQAGPWFYQGSTITPSNNDYAIYLNTSNEVWRAHYDGAQWVAQYRVNESPFTAAQLAAINSGITAALVAQITANRIAIEELQSRLSDNYLPIAGAALDTTLILSQSTNMTDTTYLFRVNGKARFNKVHIGGATSDTYALDVQNITYINSSGVSKTTEGSRFKDRILIEDNRSDKTKAALNVKTGYFDMWSDNNKTSNSVNGMSNLSGNWLVKASVSATIAIAVSDTDLVSASDERLTIRGGIQSHGKIRINPITGGNAKTYIYDGDEAFGIDRGQARLQETIIEKALRFRDYTTTMFHGYECFASEVKFKDSTYYQFIKDKNSGTAYTQFIHPIVIKNTIIDEISDVYSNLTHRILGLAQGETYITTEVKTIHGLRIRGDDYNTGTSGGKLFFGDSSYSWIGDSQYIDDDSDGIYIFGSNGIYLLNTPSICPRVSSSNPSLNFLGYSDNVDDADIYGTLSANSNGDLLWKGSPVGGTSDKVIWTGSQSMSFTGFTSLTMNQTLPINSIIELTFRVGTTTTSYGQCVVRAVIGSSTVSVGSASLGTNDITWTELSAASSSKAIMYLKLHSVKAYTLGTSTLYIGHKSMLRGSFSGTTIDWVTTTNIATYLTKVKIIGE